jgi:hypothetical protein
MIDPIVTELRLMLRARGFLPIPLEGKRPPMEGWQTKAANADEIRGLWPKVWHLAENTGILAKFSPGLDIDILDEDAAEAIEHLAREHFEERGTFTTRIGLWPKRLIPLRTDEPFTKLVRSFRAPDGTRHKIEILADGQQWVTSGTHPDTHAPYRWINGEPGRDFAREDLPYVRREDIERFLDDAVTLLDEQHGFTLVTGMTDANGRAHEAGEPLAAKSRVEAAVRVIPNGDVEWDDWNRIGMAIWAATNGSAEGFEIFDAWSQKSRKYNARATSKKWTGYNKSPPTSIGFGTLKHLADKFDSTWEDALRGEPPEPHPDDPGPQPGLQPDPQPQPRKKDQRRPVKMTNAEDLKTMTFNPIKYVVPGIFVEGLTLLAGKPKIGKSWLILHAALAVARGGFTLGEIHRPEGDVLYCALEDNERRMQARMTKLLGISQPWPKRLTFCHELPRLGAGGAEVIRDWILSVPSPRMVAVDPLAMIRTLKKADESTYQSDYLALIDLRKLANGHGVSLPTTRSIRFPARSGSQAPSIPCSCSNATVGADIRCTEKGAT